MGRRHGAARRFVCLRDAVECRHGGRHVPEGLASDSAKDRRAEEDRLFRAGCHHRLATGIRQNLALVLGLEGKFQEADAVARQELDPDQANANVAYLRSMLTQTNTWKQARQQG